MQGNGEKQGGQWEAEAWRGGGEASGEGMAREGRLTALVTTKVSHAHPMGQGGVMSETGMCTMRMCGLVRIVMAGEMCGEGVRVSEGCLQTVESSRSLIVGSLSGARGTE